MKARFLPAAVIAFGLLFQIPVVAASSDELPLAAPKVKSVALFKNGLGFFFKSAETPLKDGWACLDSLPDAALGSFWIGTLGKGGPITDLVTYKQKLSESVDATSIAELLEVNTGKRVALLYTVGSETTRLEGTLVGVPSSKRIENPEILRRISASDYRRVQVEAAIEVDRLAGSIVLLKVEGKDRTTVRALNKANIQSLELLESPVLTNKREYTQPRIKFRVGGNPRSAEVTMTYLEKGITWSPSYRIDIANEKTAEISLDAVLANDAEDLDDTEVSFVVGYPNFLYSDFLSPLSSRQMVSEFIQSLLSGRGTDANSPFANVMSQSIRYEPRSDASMAYSSRQPLPGEASQDLYFYRKTGVTLKKGERASYGIFTAPVPYEHIYEWNISDNMNIDEWGHRRDGNSGKESDEQVWHTVRLRNSTKQPWTTAPAFVVNGTLPVAQDILKFTPPGAKNTVRLTVASDVHGEASQVETDRQSVKLYGNNYIVVTVDGKLKVTNSKSSGVNLEVKKSLVGEVIAASENGVATKIASKINSVNPVSESVWTFALPAGETKELTYQYKVLFRN
jgi:hypothetical protein